MRKLGLAVLTMLVSGLGAAEATARIGSPYGSAPKDAERLYEARDCALYAGETAADTVHNKGEGKKSLPEIRNSLFLRRRTEAGTDEWRLVLTSGGNWKDADGMDQWCRGLASDARRNFAVRQARLSADGRFIWLVCDPHTGFFSIVCCYNLAEDTFRVLIDGGSVEELPNGMIRVDGKKTYLSDETGEPLGAGWYDVWMSPDGKVVAKTRPAREGMDIGQYELDEETAKLRRDFENAWLPHVAGYTDHTHYGMAQAHWDKQRFVREWRPRLIRNQVNREKDVNVRLGMVEWMVKEDSIAGLYYGMLIPHRELMDRRAAYLRIANLQATIDGVDLRFRNGRATWMSKVYKDCEMTALIKQELVWPRKGGDVFAFVQTNNSENFKSGWGSDSLANFWLLRFSGTRCVSVHRLPHKDVEWTPFLPDAPFGRKYTLDFLDGKACVMNCTTGKVVLSVKE